MGDANTVPHSVKVFEEETKSAAEIVAEISEVLLAADGDFIERIANEVLTQNTTYIGDSMFTQMISKEV